MQDTWWRVREKFESSCERLRLCTYFADRRIADYQNLEEVVVRKRLRGWGSHCLSGSLHGYFLWFACGLIRDLRC